METQSQAADPFIGELKRWRDVRRLAQTALTKRTGYTPSYVSKSRAANSKRRSTSRRTRIEN